jgi:hypothetical protein
MRSGRRPLSAQPSRCRRLRRRPVNRTHSGRSALGARAALDAPEETLTTRSQVGGKEAFPILPAYDPKASKAVIHCLKPRHPTVRLFQRTAGPFFEPLEPGSAAAIAVSSPPATATLPPSSSLWKHWNLILEIDATRATNTPQAAPAVAASSWKLPAPVRSRCGTAADHCLGGTLGVLPECESRSSAVHRSLLLKTTTHTLPSAAQSTGSSGLTLCQCTVNIDALALRRAPTAITDLRNYSRSPETATFGTNGRPLRATAGRAGFLLPRMNAHGSACPPQNWPHQR